MLKPLHVPISMHKTQSPEPKAKPAPALGAVTPAGGQGQGQRSRQALCGHQNLSPACRFPSPEHDPCAPATQPEGPGQAGRSLASWLLAEGFQQGEAQTKSFALPRHCPGTASRLDLFPVTSPTGDGTQQEGRRGTWLTFAGFPQPGHSLCKACCHFSSPATWKRILQVLSPRWHAGRALARSAAFTLA